MPALSAAAPLRQRVQRLYARGPEMFAVAGDDTQAERERRCSDLLGGRILRMWHAQVTPDVGGFLVEGENGAGALAGHAIGPALRARRPGPFAATPHDLGALPQFAESDGRPERCQAFSR
jgi:hypothetical protein